MRQLWGQAPLLTRPRGLPEWKSTTTLFSMRLIAFLCTLLSFVATAGTATAFGMSGAPAAPPMMVDHPGAAFCVIVFVLSFVAIMFEERTQVRRSRAVLLGAGIIWMTIAIIAPDYGVPPGQIRAAAFHGMDQYVSLLVFILTGMMYVAALQERQVFGALRSRLVQAGFNMRQLFWITGALAFFLAPVAGTMASALVLGAVVMAVGANDPKFITLSCINIVNAVNAGGVFSPFGDVSTLMMWQTGALTLWDFSALFVPALACFLVPAVAMNGFIARHRPLALAEPVVMKRGAKAIMALGVFTLVLAVLCDQWLGLPPFIGMAAGLSLLMVASYVIAHVGAVRDPGFDAFGLLRAGEWDVLLFLFGVVLSVGGLAYLGWLNVAAAALYDGYGAHAAPIMLGLASSVFDGAPVMYGALSAGLQMPEFHALLLTLTTGIGGSVLSIGSAAGIALMALARGQYSFARHLRWTPVILLGYIAAITLHYAING